MSELGRDMTEEALESARAHAYPSNPLDAPVDFSQLASRPSNTTESGYFTPASLGEWLDFELANITKLLARAKTPEISAEKEQDIAGCIAALDHNIELIRSFVRRPMAPTEWMQGAMVLFNELESSLSHARAAVSSLLTEDDDD